MNLDKKISDRFDELITRGDAVLATKRNPPSHTIGFGYQVDNAMASQWVANVRALLRSITGEDGEHYKLIIQALKSDTSYGPILRAHAILKAAKEDIEGGYINNIRTLVSAEVFSDILDQAHELLDSGYYGPAAVLAGGVLEDELRNLCKNNGIPLPTKPKLDFMNSELVKNGIYTLLVQKRITHISGIRNSAAHGNWSDFKKEDVADMLPWVSRFIEDYHGN